MPNGQGPQRKHGYGKGEPDPGSGETETDTPKSQYTTLVDGPVKDFGTRQQRENKERRGESGGTTGTRILFLEARRTNT